MAITPQTQRAIDRICAAIVAAHPEQDAASWNRTLVGYTTVPPPPGSYYQTKLARLFSGTNGTRTLAIWAVTAAEQADIDALRALWGV